MEQLKNIKSNKNKMYWCNIILSDMSYKIVIAELTDKKNEIFTLFSNSKKIKTEKGWRKSVKISVWFF